MKSHVGIIDRFLKPVLLAIFLGFSPAMVLAQEDDEPLMPEEAFPAEIVSVENDTISVRWNIADNYYMYRSKFRFLEGQEAIALGEPVLPPGRLKHDEFFGDVEVYRDGVTAKLPYSRSRGAPSDFMLTAVSQGCADIGICYPPYKQVLKVSLPAVGASGLSVPNPIDALSNFGKSLGFGNGYSDDEFLEPDQAFQLITTAGEDNAVRLDFTVAEGYYLYRDKIRIILADDHPKSIRIGDLRLPQGKIKADEYFGDVPVFYKGVTAYLPATNNSKEILPFTLKVQYQGCADAGLCYPPITKSFELSAPPGIRPATAARVVNRPVEAMQLTEKKTQAARQAASTQDAYAMVDAGAAGASATAVPKVAEQDRLAAFLLQNPLWLSALLFFGLGMLLAFTPCVFPMIPILSGIIIGQGKELSTGKAFTLSLVYVLAMALTYTAVGIIAGLFGANLQAVFQDPVIISIFAAVFVLLSLSMFGFYDLQMPGAIQSRLTRISNSQRGGTLAGVAIMGVLSAIIVGPCVTAPLLGALIVIGQAGDAVLGGTALFALSMGMGAPLLLIGTSAGKLLPRAGIWMDAIKAVFGVGLLAVAIWLLERVIPGPVGLFLWAILFIVSAVYMGALSQLEGDSGWHRLWKGLGIVILVWGILMVIGASTGSRDMLNPLKKLNVGGGGSATAGQGHLNFGRVKTVDDFKRELAAANSRGQYVMLDFYADWCVYCIQMEERTFPDSGVRQALSGAHLLQADVTANDGADQALLKHFGLIAPPAILFFTSEGQERKNYRVVGFQGPVEFKAHLDEVLK